MASKWLAASKVQTNLADPLSAKARRATSPSGPARQHPGSPSPQIHTSCFRIATPSMVPRVAPPRHAPLATPPILRLPLPPLADQAVLFPRRLASMQRDARDVARPGRASAASRYALAAGRNRVKGASARTLARNASTAAPLATSKASRTRLRHVVDDLAG